MTGKLVGWVRQSDASWGRRWTLGRTEAARPSSAGNEQDEPVLGSGPDAATLGTCRESWGKRGIWVCQSQPLVGELGHGDRACLALPLGRRVLSLLPRWLGLVRPA